MTTPGPAVAPAEDADDPVIAEVRVASGQAASPTKTDTGGLTGPKDAAASNELEEAV